MCSWLILVMENQCILQLKTRRVVPMGGSFYIGLPQDWVNTHNIVNRRSVKMFIDSESRLIVEAFHDENQIS